MDDFIEIKKIVCCSNLDAQYDTKYNCDYAVKDILKYFDWQPIATAPLDGTEVILYFKKSNIIAIGFYQGCWLNRWDHEPFFNLEDDPPTHWKLAIKP